MGVSVRPTGVGDLETDALVQGVDQPIERPEDPLARRTARARGGPRRGLRYSDDDVVPARTARRTRSRSTRA
jgi:hypothetical protein